MVQEHIDKMSNRPEDSHKGDYGRVMVLAGSIGMTGAAYLCSQGALTAGSGLVTCAVPESLNNILEIKLTEVMTLPLDETKQITVSLKAKSKILNFSERADVVAIGPGLGSGAEVRKLIRSLVKDIKKPIVLDADGLNAIGSKKNLLAKRKGRLVLTPHPGEMARLLNVEVEDVQSEREEVTKSLALETGSVVCLKGHRTVVADPEGNIYVNDTGNSGMATAGTGDVLTGMISSFIGQGVSDFSAACCAAYIHGLAGDCAAEALGAFCMTATDILDFLPEAFERAGI